MLGWSVALVLALGIFPSFTSLSAQLMETFPEVAGYLGPMNVIKIAAPLLLYYAWTESHRLTRAVRVSVLSAILVCIVSTVLAGWSCEYPALFLRETATIILGLLCGTCFLLLSRPKQIAVLGFWGLVVFGSALLDLASPKSIDWLFVHIFDPATKATDINELGRRVLTGIFGRQSLAKMLAWLPWIFISVSLQKKGKMFWPLVLGALAVIATGSVLATSQRGPFVGGVCAWLIFTAHQYFKLRNKKLAVVALAALLASMAITAVVVPRDVLEPRLRSLLGMKHQESQRWGEVADANAKFRARMNRVSVKAILHHPLGSPCIPKEEFLKEGVIPHHAHQMVLQQFRERGWVWGTLHLGLWLLAFLGGWRNRSALGSAIAAGVASIMVAGLVDHPWFVINQAMVLSVMMLLGISTLSFGRKA